MKEYPTYDPNSLFYFTERSDQSGNGNNSLPASIQAKMELIRGLDALSNSHED
jgi:hypothetical protein